MSSRADTNRKTGPLSGVKVVDATSTLMGPYCTQILADLGAEVIKVESHFGDTTRYLPPSIKPGCGGMFMNINRGKKSIALDLKHAKGREIMLRLVGEADIFVHSMRAQAVARLGLTYKDACKAREHIIYANLYGFGRGGPYADLPAYDDVIQAASGLAMLQSRLQGSEPTYVASAIADKVGGLTAAYSIIAALFSRSQTGQGQEIEVPMFETLVAFVMTEHLSGAIFDPPLGEPVYERIVAPDRRPYRTSDGYIAVMIYSDKQWRRFFDILDNPDWSKDPSFASMTSRADDINRVYGKLAEILLQQSTAKWLEALREAEIPAMELYGTNQSVTDPHLEAVGFWRQADGPGGAFKYPGIPTRFSNTPGSIAHAAPHLGQDSRAILHGLGIGDTEIDALVDQNVVLEHLEPSPSSSPSMSSMAFAQSKMSNT